MRNIKSLVRYAALSMVTALGLIACGGGSMEHAASTRSSSPPVPSLQPAADQVQPDPHWRIKKDIPAVSARERPVSLEVNVPGAAPAQSRRAPRLGSPQPTALAVGKPIEAR